MGPAKGVGRTALVLQKEAWSLPMIQQSSKRGVSKLHQHGQQDYAMLALPVTAHLPGAVSPSDYRPCPTPPPTPPPNTPNDRRRQRAATRIASTWRQYSERTQCRICLGPGAMSVCQCSGLAHPSCLVEWMRTSDRRRCELCTHPFKVVLPRLTNGRRQDEFVDAVVIRVLGQIQPPRNVRPNVQRQIHGRAPVGEEGGTDPQRRPTRRAQNTVITAFLIPWCERLLRIVGFLVGITLILGVVVAERRNARSGAAA